MSVQLVGRNNNVADVNENGLQLVEALALDPMAYYSKEGSAAYWNSTYSVTGGQEVLYIQNLESRGLHIARMRISSTVASLWTLFKVTSTTAAGGTAITPVNPNLSAGTPGLENSFGNASVTGSLSGDTLMVGSHALESATTATLMEQKTHEFGGAIILGENDAIALTLTTAGVIQLQVEGYWA